MKTKFVELPTTLKGTIGEQIIKRYYRRQNMAVYTAIDHPAPIDLFVMDSDPNGQHIFVECKCYARFAQFNKTGIDLHDWFVYRSLDNLHPVYIYWLDQFEEMIYYSSLQVLEKFAQIQGEKVCFSLNAMNVLRRLTERELEILNQVKPIDKRKYEQTERFFANQGVY